MVVKLVLLSTSRKLTALWFIIACVVKTFVTNPRNSGELGVDNFRLKLLFGFDINDEDLTPIATTFRNGISHKCVVFRELHFAKRCRSFF